MTWRYLPFVLLLVLSGIISAWIAGYAWQRRRAPGGIYFAALMSMGTLWSLAYAVELSLLETAPRIFLSQTSYLAILSMGPLWLLFALENGQMKHWFTGWRIALLWIVPAVIMGLVVTNSHHGLIWPSILPADDAPGSILIYAHGIGVWISVAYAYTLLAIGTILLIRQTFHWPAIHRKQVWILVIGVILPWLGNILYNAGIWLQPGLDLTPIMFTLTGLAFAWGIFRFHILDIVPIAREMVIENMRDGMLVLDLQDRVLDINLAACQLMNCQGERVIGRPVSEVLHQWPDLVERIQDVAHNQSEVQLSDPSWVEINISPLYDQHKHKIGRLVNLRDISSRIGAEVEARQRGAIAEALRDTAAALNSTLDFEQVLDNILANVQRVLPHDTANIMLINEQGQAYVVRERGYAERGLADLIRDFRLSAAETYYLQTMIATAQPIVVPDTRSDPKWIQVEAFASNRSYAGIPIQQKGKVVGFINLDSEKPGYFTSAHIERLHVFADQAALAIENARLFEQVRQNAEQMTSIHEIGLSITSTLDLRQVLTDLYAHINKVLKPDVFYIAIYHEDTYMLEFPFFHDYEKDVQLDPYDIRGKPGLTAEVIRTRKPLYLADLNDPETARLHPVNRHNKTPPSRTYIGVPMIVRDHVVGVVSIQDYRPGMFGEREVRLLETIATQAAIAIENARLFEQARQNAEQMKSLYEIGLSITSKLEQSQILKDLFDQVKQIIAPDVFYVTTYNEVTGMLDFPLFSCYGQIIQVPSYNIHILKGLAARVVLRRQTLRLDDLMDPETEREYVVVWSEDSPPSRTYVGVPMIAHDHVVGVISIEDQQPKAFSDDEVRLLETIATQAAIAIQNARLYAEVQRLATVDELTGVHNRRGLFEFGQREISRALRFKRSLSVLFVDIDHFKLFNDSYSYEVGDQMLRAITGCLRDHLREVDLIGRYGGEEFVILLPEIQLEAAIEIAERLRKAVESLRVVARPGELVVTVSIGVTAFDPQEEEPFPVHSEEGILNHLIDQAGQMLHLAKGHGRNYVASPA